MLPPLDAIGLEPADQSSFSMGRGGSGSGMRRQASGAGKGVGLGFPGSGFGKAGPPNPFMGGMGNFSAPNKLSSEEQFQRLASLSGSPGGFGIPSGRSSLTIRSSN